MGEYYPYPNPNSENKSLIPSPPFRVNSEKTWTQEGFDLKIELENIGGPVVEIAGPTPDGYIPLDKKSILPEEPIFTNRQLEIDHIDRKLDMVVDGSHMPFPDDSIGVLLVSGLSFRDESGGRYDLSTITTGDALQEYKDYAGPGTAKLNLRIIVLEESARTLKPGGILIWQAAEDGDIKAATLNGLEAKERIIGQYDDDPAHGMYFEEDERVVIFQKPLTVEA